MALPSRKPIFLTDFDDDIGMPKGTALFADGLLPFSMGNEPFDGFLVVVVPKKTAVTIVSHWGQLIEACEVGARHPNNLEEIARYASAIVQPDHQLIYGWGNVKITYPSNADRLWVSAGHWQQEAAPLFERRVLTTLGALRTGSVSKYVELCRDDEGLSYLVVHSGVGNLSSVYLSFAKALGVSDGERGVKAGILLRQKHMPGDLSFSRIAWLLDVMRRMAWVNRLLIADYFLQGQVADCSILFHDEHAFVVPFECAFLHCNSVHLAKGRTRGFMSGKDENVVFDIMEPLTKFGFYPHQTKPTEQARAYGFAAVTDNVATLLADQGYIAGRIALHPIQRYKVA